MNKRERKPATMVSIIDGNAQTSQFQFRKMVNQPWYDPRMQMSMIERCKLQQLGRMVGKPSTEITMIKKIGTKQNKLKMIRNTIKTSHRSKQFEMKTFVDQPDDI